MANLTTWIQRLFLISAFIASLTCFARPDYNLPLYIFTYMAWGLQRVEIFFYNYIKYEQSQKGRIAWLLVFTLIIDIIWVLYWATFWGSSSFEKGYWENGIHNFVVALSILNLILKVKNYKVILSLFFFELLHNLTFCSQ